MEGGTMEQISEKAYIQALMDNFGLTREDTLFDLIIALEEEQAEQDREDADGNI